MAGVLMLEPISSLSRSRHTATGLAATGRGQGSQLTSNELLCTREGHVRDRDGEERWARLPPAPLVSWKVGTCTSPALCLACNADSTSSSSPKTWITCVSGNQTSGERGWWAVSSPASATGSLSAAWGPALRESRGGSILMWTGGQHPTAGAEPLCAGCWEEAFHVVFMRRTCFVHGIS